ncbi:hypothetical protein DL764_003459 [Monosporascus ibericus]|uniref:Carboxylesterase type B domain-containing protein n=1 Tax=Monosporascus ibericus TaxID=155417 RepID=A0A4Q4TGF7_9PEZI|nr:hypothetical protein DL764_003459 [Monosporascus ibericus]
MASVAVDSELMTQYVAAVPVPNSSRFFTVRDERGLPLLFSLSNTGVLFAFKENESGARIMLDMSAAFGVQGNRVVTFNVIQEMVTDFIFFCFAYVKDPNASGEETSLVFSRPFVPAALNTSGSFSLVHLIIREAANYPAVGVSKILLGPKNPRASYPPVMLAYVPLDQVHNSSDLARVAVDSSQSTWTLKTDVELPENAAQVVDVCPAILPAGTGFFVLYLVQGKIRLIFETMPDSSGFSFKVALQAPPGLLVGGSGLYFWTPAQAQERNHRGRLISDAPGFDGVDQLQLAQASTSVSVFASTSQSALSYATSRSTDFSEPLNPVLLAQGAGNFAPFIAPDLTTQQLIVSSDDNSLSLLQQNSVSGIWTTLPFYIPSLEENIKFDGFMARITLRSDKGQLLAEETFLLKSPEGWIDMLVNGRNVTVGPDGIPVISDPCGTLTLLIPTDDISSLQFVLTDAGQGFPAHLGKEINIDPSRKVLEKVMTIKNGQDLRDAQLPDGSKLLSDSDALPEDIDAAADCIAKLGEQYDNIARGAALRGAARSLSTTGSHIFRPGLARTGKDLDRLHYIAGVGMKRVLAAKSITDVNWDQAKYWWDQVRRIGSVAVDLTLEGAVLFVIEIAGEFFRLLIETVEELAKTISMVFDKVLNAWEKFKEWVSFLFNFDDILKVKNALKVAFDGGLGAMGQVFRTLHGGVDDAFDDLQTLFGSAHGVDEVSSTTGGNKSDDEHGLAAEHRSTMNNSSFQFVSYQLSHGGAASFTKSTARSLASTEKGDPNPLLEFRNSEKFVQSEDLPPILADLCAPFIDKGNLSMKECAAKLEGNVLGALLDAVKPIFTSGLEGIEESVATFRTLISTEIHMPVFSALYKELTGSELTLLDAVCLITAIPLTVVAKLVGVEDFSLLEQIDMTKVFSDTLPGSPSVLAAQMARTDEEPSEELRKVNERFGIASCVTRMFRVILGGVLIGMEEDKPNPVSLAMIGANRKGTFSEKQTSQLIKFVSAHPLASADPEDERFLPNIERVNGVEALDLICAMCNWIWTAPIDPTAPLQFLRWFSWIASAISDLAGVGPQTPKRITVRTVLTVLNYVFVTIVTVRDFQDAKEDNDDTARRVTAALIAQTIVDLLASVCAIVISDWQNTYHAESIVDLSDNAKGPACMHSNISAYDADFPEELVEKYGITGIGLKLLSSLTNAGIKVSEDCLTLNVWTKPQTGEKGKAVLVYIHGGSFVSGSSASPAINGQFFADEEDVVLVTINYRLTIFGFPGDPLSAQNLGLLDQRLAVEWVRDNIASFGGDPSRITVFGQSAGSVSVDAYSYAWSHDPIVNGLILMSGTMRGQGMRTKDTASEFWFNASAAVGCGDATTPAQEVYHCMVGAPAQNIARILVNTIESPGGLPYSPTIDEEIVFGSDADRPAASVPMMIGNTDNEAGLFRIFVDEPDSDEFWQWQNQVAWNCPAAARASASLRDGNPTWRYRWHGVFPNTIISTHPPSGAYHASEVAVLFSTLEQGEIPNTAQEDSIGLYMRRAWAAFAKDPVQGLLRCGGGWPHYVANETTLIRIGYENRTGPNLATGALYDPGC